MDSLISELFLLQETAETFAYRPQLNDYVISKSFCLVSP